MMVDPNAADSEILPSFTPLQFTNAIACSAAQTNSIVNPIDADTANIQVSQGGSNQTLTDVVTGDFAVDISYIGP